MKRIDALAKETATAWRETIHWRVKAIDPDWQNRYLQTSAVEACTYFTLSYAEREGIRLEEHKQHIADEKVKDAKVSPDYQKIRVDDQKRIFYESVQNEIYEEGIFQCSSPFTRFTSQLYVSCLLVSHFL